MAKPFFQGTVASTPPLPVHKEIMIKHQNHALCYLFLASHDRKKCRKLSAAPALTFPLRAVDVELNGWMHEARSQL